MNAQTVVLSPDQILAEATKASLDGDYKTALAKTREAGKAGSGDLSFATRYVTAVAAIADLSDDRHRSSLLNQALKAANEIETAKVGDGTKDAEFAWHYLVAIGKLADSIADTSPATSGKLYLAQAKVAANLKTNPGFPQESLSLLAGPLMGKAFAKAIAKDADGTLAAMKPAFEAGFTDYEMLLDNEFIKELKSDKVNALVKSKFVAYKKGLKKWARNSVANFKSFDFKFDVADIEAGRIRNSDFRGRILVLDLWATWCQPCREAIPHFVKLDKEFRSDNVDIVGISMDNPDDPRKSLKVVRNFVDDNGVEYAMAMGNRSVMNQLAPGQKLPTVLFIDTQGKVRFIAEGPHNFFQLAAITNELIKQEEDSPTSLPAIPALSGQF
ncbi:TlpA disulfide reductase family protein [Mariniblastus fucicola]|uniref:TlpA disulfide reductase family protein n=1 Tax=Mariniblastus fucicola TaxID=980251 RepID=UPI0009467B00|nr:TlpA disulfide reductase family protein [Mariniblastus fucicola]